MEISQEPRKGKMRAAAGVVLAGRKGKGREGLKHMQEAKSSGLHA